MDVARNRFVPVSVQGLAMLCGQCNSLNPGSLTRVPRGSQSPVTSSAEIARTCTGPNAEEPKRASGSTSPIAVVESSSIRPPSASDSTVRKLPSVAATSTFSLRGNFTGRLERRKKTNLPATGTSSGLPRCTGEGIAEASSCVPLLSNVTCGR